MRCRQNHRREGQVQAGHGRSGASRTGDNTWTGDLLNTEDGQTYSGVVTLAGGGLSLKGCVLGGIICKGEVWSRN